MKRLLSMITAAALLLTLAAGCGETDPAVDVPDPALENFRAALGEDDFCAVSYLGYLDGGYADIAAHMDALGVKDAFPFLDIPETHFVGTDGGEIYAVIPDTPDGAITVYEAVLDEENYTFVMGDVLAEFTDGAPILLRCNVSEIMPNVILAITSDGETYTYSPSLSGENGQLVETFGMYDFSPYDVLFSGYPIDGADDGGMKG